MKGDSVAHKCTSLFTCKTLSTAPVFLFKHRNQTINHQRRPASPVAMPGLRFLDLPFEIREKIYAAYTELIIVGFDSRVVPGHAEYVKQWRQKRFDREGYNSGLARWQEKPIDTRFKWYISLNDERVVIPENTKLAKVLHSGARIGEELGYKQ